MTFSIIAWDGSRIIAEGIQGHEVNEIAQQYAQALRESVGIVNEEGEENEPKVFHYRG